MSAPLVPSPLDYVGRRKFSLFPPISNVGPNEWLRGASSWSEAQLVNATTGQEIWISWQYICGVSDGPELQLVVELNKELDYGNGSLSPRVKRIIEMPRQHDSANFPWAKNRKRTGPAPVVGIKIEDEVAPVSLGGKIVLAVIALFVLAALVFRLARL